MLTPDREAADLRDDRVAALRELADAGKLYEQYLEITALTSFLPALDANDAEQQAIRAQMYPQPLSLEMRAFE